MKIQQNISAGTSCYHCGNDCANDQNRVEDKLFCCSGCKMVYEILHEHALCDYYELNSHPGIYNQAPVRKDKFAFLDNVEIQTKLLQYKDHKQAQVSFYLPQIHCSSCLWLLENLSTLHSGILTSRVNFTQKEIFVIFDHQVTNLRSIVEKLSQLGYEPHLSLHEIETPVNKEPDRQRWYKLGVAGFCFGNIMMMSFADYAATDDALEPAIAQFFNMTSIVLSLPVLFYAASEFFVGAWSGLKNKYLNLDFPVALALVITFCRSIYDIYHGLGPGYLDSLAGIVFFMLIGRWLQTRTAQSLSFDRDYKSFFPIAVHVIKEDMIDTKAIEDLKVHDIIQIHADEVIPVDGMITKGLALIDYSFVSGESQEVALEVGSLVYAGGRQTAGLIEVMVTKPVAQSYLTKLWNHPVFQKTSTKKANIFDQVGKYFTYVVLLLGFGAGFYWWAAGKTDLMWNAITTVLIVACPCALLLAKNFTQGNLLRIFGLEKFYLRSAEVIENLCKINHIVFDKTGTLTLANQTLVRYQGAVLNNWLKKALASLLRQSSHPHSVAIKHYLHQQDVFEVQHFKETKGMGIEAWIDDHYIKLGSTKFLGIAHEDAKSSIVVVKLDGQIVGKFTIHNKYRFGISALIDSLKRRYHLSVLSGDNNAEHQQIESLIGLENEVLFNQSPTDKMMYIQHLQHDQNGSVLMVGDGLNDAGALRQSEVGIAVADSNNTFTPAADAIIQGQSLQKLPMFLKLARQSQNIIFATFAFASIYNLIGLYFAVQGQLSPIIAAILMPASSITIISISYGTLEILAKKYFPKSRDVTEKRTLIYHQN